ncbi:MAG: restriction endonuclease subunit S [Chlorobiaceae bacterium]|nr:restriction endonuclease subunit S [Chlorobiaceae bacterium]
MSNLERGVDFPVRHSEFNIHSVCNGGLENPPSVKEIVQDVEKERGAVPTSRDRHLDEGKRGIREWKICSFSNSIIKNKVGREHQIPSKDIASVGLFPVVDQGQEFIAGYCDDESKVIDFDLPLIIFGDHTRCFKFVDFPFILGADGTKVLVPNKKIYDPKFFFFALLALELPSRGYNRHFKLLKEKSLPLPSLSEQKKIAHILSTVQRAIEAQERIIQITTELKKALMHKLFTEGLRNEPQKQTEIGLVPESWEVCKVGDVAKIQSGGTPSRDIPENWNGGTIPWVKTGEINYCEIIDTEEKITQTGLSNSAARLFPSGTLLMAMYGQGITRGKVGFLGIDAATNQACASIIPNNKDYILSIYLYYYFEYHYENLRLLGHGANQRNMNAALIRGFPLAYPKPEEQKSIGKILGSLDNKHKTCKQKQIQLQGLFRTLLHELMTAKIRVNKINMPC